jgi:mannosylglycerate hydrolase
LVSGESHIRNLWLGKRAGNELSCSLFTAGYLPDMFGHVAQMPQILQGFGIDTALVWRGLGGDPDTVKSEFWWESPDGSSVLTHWFPDGYYQMSFLHFSNPDRPYDDKLGRVFRALTNLGARATTDALLLPYGGDHCPIARSRAGKIAEANEALGNTVSTHWATIGEFMAEVRAQQPELTTVRGKLRALGALTPLLLPGVLSTRMYLKELNFRGQTWLERYAEPLSARRGSREVHTTQDFSGKRGSFWRRTTHTTAFVDAASTRCITK